MMRRDDRQILICGAIILFVLIIVYSIFGHGWVETVDNSIADEKMQEQLQLQKDSLYQDSCELAYENELFETYKTLTPKQIDEITRQMDTFGERVDRNGNSTFNYMEIVEEYCGSKEYYDGFK